MTHIRTRTEFMTSRIDQIELHVRKLAQATGLRVDPGPTTTISSPATATPKPSAATSAASAIKAASDAVTSAGKAAPSGTPNIPPQLAATSAANTATAPLPTVSGPAPSSASLRAPVLSPTAAEAAGAGGNSHAVSGAGGGRGTFDSAVFAAASTVTSDLDIEALSKGLLDICKDLDSYLQTLEQPPNMPYVALKADIRKLEAEMKEKDQLVEKSMDMLRRTEANFRTLSTRQLRNIYNA